MSIVMEINPFDFFTDTAGDALDSGFIWIGEPNKDPRQYPVVAFYDAALTIPAPMPLRTSNGYIVRNGSPTFLFINGNYSILVQSSTGSQIFYVADFLLIGSGSAVSAGDLANAVDPLKGAGLVGYHGRTVHAKLDEFASVKDYGAVGNGIADDTAAIQAALDASLFVHFGSFSDSYKLSNKLNLRSGHRVYGNGATVTQTAIRTEVFRMDNKTDIYIAGFRGVGLGTDFNDSPSSLAVAVRGVSSSRITVEKNTFTNFSCAGVFFDFASDCKVLDNIIVGPGTPILTPIISGACYGIVLDGDRMLGIGNIVSKTALGIVTGDSKTNIGIHDNIIHDIDGQHGIYAGSALTNLSITGNNVFDTELIGIKVQQFDTPGAPADNIIVANNTVQNARSHGIAVLSTAPGTPVHKMRNVAITGNVIRNCTEDGLNLGDIIVGNVSNNSIFNCTREGIGFSRLNGVRIDGNTINEAARNGMKENALSTACVIAGNSIKDCSSALAVGERNGILIQLGDTFVIEDNTIVDTTARMQYGIFISGGTQSSMSAKNNICRGMTDVGARFKSPVESLLTIEGNYFSGTLASSLNQPFSNQHGKHDRYFIGTVIPTTGTWESGDVVNFRFPSAGGFMGAVCIVSGTPGTWKNFGPVSA